MGKHNYHRKHHKSNHHKFHKPEYKKSRVKENLFWFMFGLVIGILLFGIAILWIQFPK